MKDLLIRYLYNTEKDELPDDSEICSILGLFNVSSYLTTLSMQDKNYAQNNSNYHYMKLTKDDNKYTSEFEKEKVKCEFEIKNNKLMFYECNCNDFQKNSNPCKHICCGIYDIYYEGQKEILTEILNKISPVILELTSNASAYKEKYAQYIDKNTGSNFKEVFNNLAIKYVELSKGIKTINAKSTLLDLYAIFSSILVYLNFIVQLAIELQLFNEFLKYDKKKEFITLLNYINKIINIICNINDEDKTDITNQKDSFIIINTLLLKSHELFDLLINIAHQKEDKKLKNIINDYQNKYSQLREKIIFNNFNNISSKEYKLLNSIYKKLQISLNKELSINYISYQKNKHENSSKITLLDCVNAFNDIMQKITDNSNKTKDDELEKQMDAYELEEWQKELVRKGEYDPWNFEEDGELEEDDYYYEDDK